MHQVGNQPRLYYDTRSANHQELLECVGTVNISTENLSYSGLVVRKHIRQRSTQTGMFWRKTIKVVLKQVKIK